MCCGRKFSLTEGGCFDLALVDYLGVGLADITIMFASVGN